MTKHIYSVQIPIAGHVTVSVEAENEEEAASLAMDVTDYDDTTWETLDKFTSGNVCYCPRPWSVEVTDEGEAE